MLGGVRAGGRYVGGWVVWVAVEVGVEGHRCRRCRVAGWRWHGDGAAHGLADGVGEQGMGADLDEGGVVFGGGAMAWLNRTGRRRLSAQ